MRPLTYSEFFRLFVQRKRQELVAPRFIGIGEITLPDWSVLHYFPKEGGDIGPDNAEAFVSNYQGDIFVDFSPVLTPVIGHGRMGILNPRQAIQGYRASHYKYNWTKNIDTIWNKRIALMVVSYGLALKPWIPRPSIFVNFETHYNRYHMLMSHINMLAAREPARKHFLRIDLPVNLPGWTKLLQTMDHYIGSFKDGQPVVNNQAVANVKSENSYWLLDLLTFLLGDYGYSQFGTLSEKALANLHVMFVSDSRCLTVNFGTWKSWLDELEKPSDKKAVEGKSNREAHQKRLNVVKRIYLSLLTLTNNGVPAEEVVKEEATTQESSNETTENASTHETDPPVGQGPKGTEKGQGQAPRQHGSGQAPGQDVDVATPSAPGDLFELFQQPKGFDSRPLDGTAEAGSGTDTEEHEEWTAAVEDHLLEPEVVSAVTQTSKDPFPTKESGVIAALDERAREGSLTVAEYNFFKRKAEQYRHIELENGQTLEEFIHIEPTVITSLKEDAKITGNFVAIDDETMLQSRAKVLKQGYVDKILHKDIASMFLAVQNTGIALNDFRHEEVSGIEGSYDVYKVQLHDVLGDQNTISVRFPKVADDGSCTIDGVKTHMQLQRMELPIRKISKSKVALTSHYDRKLMVFRSTYRVDDASEWYTKQIVLKGKAKSLTFSRGNQYDASYKAPRLYSILSSKFQWIQTDSVLFDFRLKNLLKEHPEFKKYTKLNSFLIGVQGKDPVLLDNFGNVSVGDKELGTLESLLGITSGKVPTEPVVINLGNYLFPIGVVLCFYFGIDELIKVTKATTRTVPMGTRPQLTFDEYALVFNDEYLIFNRRERVPTMIFSGLMKLNNISNFSRSDLNDKNIWGPLMADPRVRPSQFREMKQLYDMFIDPITKTQLQRMGYSDSFHYLLIDAVRLLETDQTRNEVELEEQRIVGYERFAGHLYRELNRSIRTYRNKGTGRKHKLDFNPEAVIQNILADTSVNLVEEVNPVHQMKDQEEVTFGGVGGRSEITMVKRARTQKDSYRGVISEANKDSGKVGVVTYLTSDPRIIDYRGNIAIDEEPSETSLLSVTGNLSTGFTKDD